MDVINYITNYIIQNQCNRSSFVENANLLHASKLCTKDNLCIKEIFIVMPS